MAHEVLFDTSGFFALLDQFDPANPAATKWITSERARLRPLTTEWIVGETCTLLIARRRPYLVRQFLDYLEQSTALLVVNPDETLIRSARKFIRRQAEQGYSFVDCLSFCVMKERKISEALTTDAHFRKAGFSPLLERVLEFGLESRL
ncbi:MAG TPA: PIN domain-containing protein [Verrucomicrobiae bacterium]|nr:PIN domain-containing protein [Verrucomicrobiae bacterium]